MDKQQILQIAQQDPRFSQAIQAMESGIKDFDVPPESVDDFIQMLEMAVNNPAKWPEIRAAAIADGLADEEDLPTKADPVFLISVLVALYGLQDGIKNTAKFARGGLAKAAQKLQAQGRHGDTMLAHITPREAMMLKSMGGSGSINPATGLPEYFSWKKLLKAVVPIALTFLAPGIGTAIGSALGASAAWAPVVGSAIMGAGTSALTGGNIVQGALLGGLTGGLGSMAGGAASDALGLGLGKTGQAVLGSGLLGGVGGMATGKGFAQGAMQGVAGQAVGNILGGMGGDGAFGNAINTGANQFSNMMTAGYDPKQSAIAGGLAGVVSGVTGMGQVKKPSDVVLNQMQNPNDIQGINVSSELNQPMQASTPQTAAVKPTSFMDSAAKLLPLASMISSFQAPEPVKQAVSQLSAQQQEYFNRPSVQFDWDRMQQDANQSGLDLGRYMAQNWNQISSGAYNTTKLARGGALSRIAGMAQGSGSGRDDTIDAKLSDGEYVIDAETVAMLGDGSSQAGAKELDRMREKIRSHKGAALAKGKFSPNAKSPLQYLQGAR
jgi:hypothetical protein